MQVFQTFFKIASKRIGAISTYFIIYIFVTFALSFSTADTAETQFQTSSLTISILDARTAQQQAGRLPPFSPRFIRRTLRKRTRKRLQTVCITAP